MGDSPSQVPPPSSEPQPASAPRGAPAPPLDPYKDWLGVQTVERPPSHYALLGLVELENDARTIAEAARRAKKTVRAYQIGKYRKEALGLLTEIGQAVDVLTSSQKKAGYDRQRLDRAIELAEANFPHAELGRPLDEMFADWLAQCDKSRLPVPQMIPHLIRWCLDRSFAWPPRGPHKVPLPLGLWIYFEAAVIGQCVERSPIEQRVRAVKQIQQAFGVTEQLSRIVNLAIARRPQAFAGTELVRTAADQPRDLMQQWVDRLAAREIVLDSASRTFSSLAFLLGLVEEDGQPIAEPIRPRTIRPPRPSPAALLLRSARDLGERALDRARDVFGRCPALKFALLIAAVFVLIVLVLLILY